MNLIQAAKGKWPCEAWTVEGGTVRKWRVLPLEPNRHWAAPLEMYLVDDATGDRRPVPVSEGRYVYATEAAAVEALRGVRVDVLVDGAA